MTLFNAPGTLGPRRDPRVDLFILNLQPASESLSTRIIEKPFEPTTTTAREPVSIGGSPTPTSRTECGSVPRSTPPLAIIAGARTTDPNDSQMILWLARLSSEYDLCEVGGLQLLVPIGVFALLNYRRVRDTWSCPTPPPSHVP